MNFNTSNVEVLQDGGTANLDSLTYFNTSNVEVLQGRLLLSVRVLQISIHLMLRFFSDPSITLIYIGIFQYI